MKMKILHTLGIIGYIAMMLIGAWSVISYIDIIWDNFLPNPHHFSWNLFVLLTENAR